MKKEFLGIIKGIFLLILVFSIFYLIDTIVCGKNISRYCIFLSPSQREERKTPEAVPQISGNKDDLISFSILPGVKVHGVLSYRGVIKGGYFFEGNILINVLDVNKNSLKKSNAVATTDWMTSGPVSFEGNIDFSLLPKGPSYVEIHNDNPSDIRANDKSILIPIIIE